MPLSEVFCGFLLPSSHSTWSDYPFPYSVTGLSITVQPLNVVILLSSFFSFIFPLGYLIYIFNYPTPYSLMSHRFSTDNLCSNYTHLFKIPQISIACLYLSLHIIFPLPNKLLAIMIIASRYHLKFSIYQCLWTAFPAVPHKRESSNPACTWSYAGCKHLKCSDSISHLCNFADSI